MSDSNSKPAMAAVSYSAAIARQNIRDIRMSHSSGSADNTYGFVGYQTFRSSIAIAACPLSDGVASISVQVLLQQLVSKKGNATREPMKTMLQLFVMRSKRNIKCEKEVASHVCLTDDPIIHTSANVSGQFKTEKLCGECLMQKILIAYRAEYPSEFEKMKTLEYDVTGWPQYSAIGLYFYIKEYYVPKIIVSKGAAQVGTLE